MTDNDSVIRASALQFVEAACPALLRDLVWAMRDHAISPLLLASVDEDCPVSRLRESCLISLRGALTGLDSESIRELRKDLPPHLRDGALDTALLEQATQPHYFALDPYAFETAAKGRVFTLLPDLTARVDRDGLLTILGLDARAATIMHKGWALHYHPFLRRHFTSHVNDALISTILRMGASPDNQLRLAVDPEHVRRADDYFEYIERDYWFGPPLSRKSIDDRHTCATTVHADVKSGLTHEYPRLFVDWRLDSEGHKVVQIEELSDHPSAKQGGYRLLRYLHAIRDIERGIFIHCDGAVRAYSEPAYAEREQREFVTGRPSATQYRKLFRVDGVISTNEWSHVVTQWFRHNRLVSEYLGTLT